MASSQEPTTTENPPSPISGMASSQQPTTTENPPSPVVATVDKPMRLIFGVYEKLVVVTNRADVATNWMRRLLGEIEGKAGIAGVSFQFHKDHRADGFIFRRVVSIHIAFMTQVLVYHLTSDGLYSPDVLHFLRQPGTIFVGEDVDEGLYLLGLPYRRSNGQTMDLVRVAQLHNADHLVTTANQCGMPLHVMLAMGILRMGEGALRLNAGRAMTTWPLTTEQVEFAVQSAVVAQILGQRAYMRTRNLRSSAASGEAPKIG